MRGLQSSQVSCDGYCLRRRIDSRIQNDKLSRDTNRMVWLFRKFDKTLARPMSSSVTGFESPLERIEMTGMPGRTLVIRQRARVKMRPLFLKEWQCRKAATPPSGHAAFSGRQFARIRCRQAVARHILDSGQERSKNAGIFRNCEAPSNEPRNGTNRVGGGCDRTCRPGMCAPARAGR